jgi:hypothetical protein
MTTLTRSTALCLVLAALAGCDQPPATRDTVFNLFVYTDTATGCQYVSESRGLTPRIAADGKTHMGCKGVKP